MKSERVTRVSGEQAIALETHKHLQFSPNTMWCWFLRAGIGGTYVEDAENQVSTRWTTRIWITRRTATWLQTGPCVIPSKSAWPIMQNHANIATDCRNDTLLYARYCFLPGDWFAFTLPQRSALIWSRVATRPTTFNQLICGIVLHHESPPSPNQTTHEGIPPTSTCLVLPCHSCCNGCSSLFSCLNCPAGFSKGVKLCINLNKTYWLYQSANRD